MLVLGHDRSNIILLNTDTDHDTLKKNTQQRVWCAGWHAENSGIIVDLARETGSTVFSAIDLPIREAAMFYDPPNEQLKPQ